MPKLADIGLVTDSGGTISHVGTEGFLPPEGPGTPQADLFSLGKVLYEISTGRDRMEFPELPTLLDAGERRDQILELNLVLLKACQNDPRRRYQSAQELSADLALLRGGHSLRRARASQRRFAHARRLAFAAILVTLTAAGINHFIQQSRLHLAEQDKAREERDRRLAQGVASDTRQRLAALYTANGSVLAASGDGFGALAWFAQAASEDPSRTARTNNIAENLPANGSTLPRILAHRAAIRTAAISADGRRILTASDDQSAQVWDSATADPVGVALPHSAPVIDCDLSPDGERALTVSNDGVARLWSHLGVNPVETRLESSGRTSKARFSPNARRFATITQGAGVTLWETSGHRQRLTLLRGETITDACFSPDARRIATARADGGVQIWDAETGEPIGPVMPHETAVTTLAFSPDSRRLMVASGSQVRAWDARTGTATTLLLRHDAPIRCAAFSPDGRWIATGGADHSVHVWDAITGKLLATPWRHTEPIQCIAFSPDARSLAAAGGAKAERWDTRTFEQLPTAIVHNASITSILFHPAAHQWITSSADGTSRIHPLAEAGAAPPNPAASDSDEDRLSRATLLSGRRVARDGQLTAVPAEELRALWQKMRARHPRDFDKLDLLPWHQRAADEREKTGDWFGAAFHWQRAALLAPKETRYSTHHAAALDQIARRETLAARSPELPRSIPLRAPETRPELIDLSAQYNATLTGTWLPTNVVASGNDLSALPSGVQRFRGMDFDVRGIIQLSGGALENLGGRFPKSVDGIRVGRKCQRLHFLYGAGWSAQSGTTIGSFLVRYAGGETREVRLIFGVNVREWWSSGAAPNLTGATMAWEGANAASRSLGVKLRLYQMAWLNPLPGVEITGVDLKSAMENPAPFVLAITAE